MADILLLVLRIPFLVSRIPRQKSTSVVRLHFVCWLKMLIKASYLQYSFFLPDLKATNDRLKFRLFPRRQMMLLFRRGLLETEKPLKKSPETAKPQEISSKTEIKDLTEKALVGVKISLSFILFLYI